MKEREERREMEEREERKEKEVRDKDKDVRNRKIQYRIYIYI